MVATGRTRTFAQVAHLTALQKNPAVATAEGHLFSASINTLAEMMYAASARLRGCKDGGGMAPAFLTTLMGGSLGSQEMSRQNEIHLIPMG